MAERTRKLHVVIKPWGDVVVEACRWNVGATSERLLASTDGAVAFEVFAAANPHEAHWLCVGRNAFGAVSESASHATIARMAFYALCEPDVGAIHVADLRHGSASTFLRDRTDWLDVPRFPHPTYAVAPRAA